MTKISKQTGRLIAKVLKERTGKNIKYVTFENGKLLFSLIRYRSIRQVDSEGNIIKESEITDNMFQTNCLPVFYQFSCSVEDFQNGNAVWMIDNGYTKTN